MIFRFLFVIILLPVIVILIIIFLVTRKNYLGYHLELLMLPVIGLMFLFVFTKFFTDKCHVKREDIYGDYIIDREMFPGLQADWQYDHFRFNISTDNKLQFYLTEKYQILKTYNGTVSFKEVYSRPRIVLHLDTPIHHIIKFNPTLYRETFSFYYVFNSSKFENVFFRKGKWKPIKG